MEWTSILFSRAVAREAEHPSSTQAMACNLEHENEADRSWPVSLVFLFKIISTSKMSKSKILFYACVDERYSISLTIAWKKQT